MKKIINSATKQYVPVDTENLVLDDTPTEGSFNAVTSDGVAKAIAGGGGGSSYTAGDGIAISEGEISAKVDGSTIQVNADGELEAIGGGGAEYTGDEAVWVDNSEHKIGITLGTGGLTYAQDALTGDTCLAIATDEYSGLVNSDGVIYIKRPVPDPNDYGASVGDVFTVYESTPGRLGTHWAAPQGGSSYTAGDGIDITSDTIKVDLATNKGLEFAATTQTTFTADYQGYDLGQWGYMGIGPLHVTYLPEGPFFQLDFRPYSNSYISWNVNNGSEYYLFAYDPQDSTKYATCSVAYYADFNQPDWVGIGFGAGSSQANHLYTADVRNWDFSGGLTSNKLTSAAFGIYFPNTTGSSPMGTDYAAVGSSLLQNIGYSTNTIIPDAGKLQVKVDGTTIQVHPYTGALTAVSPLPAFNPSTDTGKVLQVQANGTLAWVTLT